jgi:hypothetical protein
MICTLRHTALTQRAEAGWDVFTLARTAGYSSIAITQRYVHPQADAISKLQRQYDRCFQPGQSSPKKNARWEKIGQKEKGRF